MDQLHEKIRLYLKNKIADFTKILHNKIEYEAGFETLGIDSLIIAEMNASLELDFGPLPKTLFFEFNNISELAEYFIDTHIDRISLFNTTSEESASIKQKEISVLSDNVNKTSDDIAIIGLAGRFPQAENIYEFWQNLKHGKDCIELIPSERWNYKDIYNTDRMVSGSSYLNHGGFIADYDKFDSLFFNISKLEAESLDPQERLFLETVYHTLEDAGYTKQWLSQEIVGVYVGIMWGQYQLYGIDTASAGSSYASIANRVSYFFNFEGPSIAIDTMCSSSLTTIHLACQSIRDGECTLAIAGGVNITVHPNKYVFLSKTGFAAKA
ncbi:MAG TPA: type I polyketide synthase, partial [Burkholderiales bacterium]|nr:type I polyketide synthase [Burkholderiales bacterium]